MIRCNKCGKECQTAQQLKVHMWAKHGGLSPFGTAKRSRKKKKN